MTDAPPPDAPTPDAPTPDAAREVLAWCLANPVDGAAIVRLNELRETLLAPDLAADVIAAAEAVMQPILAQAAPTPLVQAHVVILLTSLLQLGSEGSRVDVLLASWMRHPASFGPDRATPPEFQRPEWVQRAADLLGWGTLDVDRDRDALRRFFAWVNSWKPRHRWQVRRVIQVLERNFPAPDVWRLVHFPGA